MDNSQELLDLKIMVNQLNIELVKLKLQHQAVSSFLIGAIEEMAPGSERKIYTQIVNHLEEHTLDAIKCMEQVFYDTNDPAFLVQQMAQASLDILDLKCDPRYVGSDD